MRYGEKGGCQRGPTPPKPTGLLMQSALLAVRRPPNLNTSKEMLSTPNVVQAWLELIGTPQRANQLLDAANSAWQGCPSEILFGERGSQTAYANPRYRPALDAWDTGLVTRRDILGWAKYIATGTYKGPRFVYMVIPLNRDDSPAVAQVNDLQAA